MKTKNKKPAKNRFKKHYDSNRETINKRKRDEYHKRKKLGICTRCLEPAEPGITTCFYHQQTQGKKYPGVKK